MATRGSNLAKNPFKTAMESSYSNSDEITSKVLAALQANTTVDPRIGDLVTYLSPFKTGLGDDVIGFYSQFDTRVATTGDIKIFEKGIPAEVNIWWRMLTDVYPEGTTDFNRLWRGGNTSFYEQSRNKNLLRMQTLVTAIGSDISLDTLKTRVNTYAGTFQGLINSQTGDKTAVETGTANIDNSRDEATNALWYVYCGLMMIFLPDVDKALAYFPMEFIYQAARMRQYRLLVPAFSLRKAGMRTWKSTDMVKLVNNRSIPLLVGLTSKSSIIPTTWYTLDANTTITIPPATIGNIANKIIMVQNPSLTDTGDITVTILMG